jgi:hypothetical protein
VKVVVVVVVVVVVELINLKKIIVVGHPHRRPPLFLASRYDSLNFNTNSQRFL